MALHYGWFGNTEGGPDNDELKLMEVPEPANAYYDRGTAIDRFMWYGLRDIGNFNSYKTFADKVVDLVDDTSIKVLLEIPTAAAGNSSFINSIESTYNSVSAVGGYYLEEPPQQDPPWIASQVEDLHDVLTKDLVVSVQQAASSTVYDTYAEHSTRLASYDYELKKPDPDKVWENIETLTALGKLDAATNDFWYVMQAYEVAGAIREPTKYEVWWLAHRPIIDLAKGVLFYQYYHAPDALRLNVNDMAAQIRYESCHAAFDTAELKSTHVENLGDSNLLYSYRYYSSDYWLLVMDKDPQTENSGDYPKQVKFKCDLGSRFSQFDVLNNRYANYYEDGTTGRVVGVTDPEGTWKQFDDDGTYGIGRGEVRMYRFFT